MEILFADNSLKKKFADRYIYKDVLESFVNILFFLAKSTCRGVSKTARTGQTSNIKFVFYVDDKSLTLDFISILKVIYYIVTLITYSLARTRIDVYLHPYLFTV